MIKEGDSLTCVTSQPLEGNTVAPALKVDEVYQAIEVYECKCGQQHINVGLASDYNTITCYKCREELPRGNKIHWANAIRFVVS